MKMTKHPLVAGSVLALGLVLGAGGSAQTAPPASGTVSCKAVVQDVGCFANLHALCAAIDKSATPPLTKRDKEAMISVVVGASTRIQHFDNEQAIQDMDGLRQSLDNLSYAAKTRISEADADKIGLALSAASICIDGLN